MSKFFSKQHAAEARKALVSLAGLVAQVIAAGTLTGTAAHVAQVVLAALTLAGVYHAPNADPNPPAVYDELDVSAHAG